MIERDYGPELDPELSYEFLLVALAERTGWTYEYIENLSLDRWEILTGRLDGMGRADAANRGGNKEE